MDEQQISAEDVDIDLSAEVSTALDIVQSRQTETGGIIGIGHEADMNTPGSLTVQQSKELQETIKQSGLTEGEWLIAKAKMAGQAKRVMESTFRAVEGVGFLAPKDLTSLLKSLRGLDEVASQINQSNDKIKKVQQVNLNITADYKDLVAAKKRAAERQAAGGRVIPDNEIPTAGLYGKMMNGTKEEED